MGPNGKDKIEDLLFSIVRYVIVGAAQKKGNVRSAAGVPRSFERNVSLLNELKWPLQVFPALVHLTARRQNWGR